MGRASRQDIMDMYWAYVKDEYQMASDDMNKQAISFWQNLLLVSLTLVGVLVSLYDNTQQNQYTRVVFLLSLVLLTLCSLVCGIILYVHSTQSARYRRDLMAEFERALNHGCPMEEVMPGPNKTLDALQKIAFLLLLLSVFSILTYAFIKVFMVC